MLERPRHTTFTCVFALVALTLHAGTVTAQTTRADEYAEAQQKKAASPIGPIDTRGERIAKLIERVGTPPTGVFPFFGNIYPGSFLAVGPGYRRPFNSGAVVIGKAAWSLRNFKTADVQFHSPRFAQDRVHLIADAGWLDAPRLDFYGRGNDTNRSDRVRFGLRPVGANAALQIAPARFVRIDAGWGVETYESRPESDGAPSTIDLTLGTTTLSGTIDWRPSPGWANTGGAARIAWKGRRSLGSDEVAFNEYEGEVTQLVPILRGNWVLALHGLATTTDASEGEVPFFLLPSVGGGTARGLVNFRFRDRHRLATSAELRWSAAQVMDLAVFVDAARVAATRRQLDFNDLHTSVGFGARFHTPNATVFRAEIARSKEGFRFTIGGGPVF